MFIILISFLSTLALSLPSKCPSKKPGFKPDSVSELIATTTAAAPVVTDSSVSGGSEPTTTLVVPVVTDSSVSGGSEPTTTLVVPVVTDSSASASSQPTTTTAAIVNTYKSSSTLVAPVVTDSATTSSSAPSATEKVPHTDNFVLVQSWTSDPAAPWVYYKSRMVIPPTPPSGWKTTFIWPGLQPIPQGANFLPIDNGVLQPVLTWGDSCAPNRNIVSTETWWISAQYVNTFGSEPSHTGCYGGNRMALQANDSISMVFSLREGTTTWDQVITNERTNEKVDFSIDMRGQAQHWGSFVMELYGDWLRSSVPSWQVTDIELRTSAAQASCVPNTKISSEVQQAGAALSCAPPTISGNTCRVQQCNFN